MVTVILLATLGRQGAEQRLKGPPVTTQWRRDAMCFWLSGLQWKSVSQFLHMSVKTNKQSGGAGCGGSATCSNLAWPAWRES